MAEQVEQIFQLLCSSQKLERDKGSLELQNFLKETNDSAVRGLEHEVQRLLDDPAASWESLHGGLTACRLLLERARPLCSDDFVHACKDYSLRLLEQSEFRVRIAAGDVMGILCKSEGPQIYATTRDIILEGVRTNLERQPIGEATVGNEKLVEKLSSSPSEQRLADAEQIFHDTAGWKSLETWMKCLQAVIDGCGPTFNSFIDQELLDLIFTALTHTNRFVRETGYYVCASLVGCNYVEDQEVVSLTEENAIYRHGHQFAEQLGQGLADNWSQVRLAASTAARQFLISLGLDEVRQKFYGVLLPPLCLNRYYVAEGVRIYNQETWRRVTGGDGKHLVEIYIKEVVAFYVSQSEADNHAVREAACACIAELGSKINRDAVRTYVPVLLDALLVCFKDQSWPVRDASCVACGNFVLCFPEESKPVMPDLYPLFYENLQDNIPSVRQGAALALANVIKAYGEEAIPSMLEKIQAGLEGVEHQSANAEKYSALDKGPATYGVVKRMRDNDMELHTDKQMYSCGSLAPKMHRGQRGGGCMDHQFRRPPEPWEMADGCVCLVAELSSIPELAGPVTKLLPLVAKAAGFQHYTQHVHFLETLCNKLPVIAKGLGKRPFKSCLEVFLEPIFYSQSCDNMLTSSAASQCLSELSRFLGPNILRGRVEQYCPAYLHKLEECLGPC